MKSIYLIVGMLLVGLVTETNAQLAPRTEFAIQLSKNALEVKPGTSAEFDVTIVRSKGYSKSSAKLGLSTTLPEGIFIDFEPASGLFETSLAIVRVSDAVKPGLYQIVVRGEINRIVKGAILKVNVLEAPGKEIVTLN